MLFRCNKCGKDLSGADLVKSKDYRIECKTCAVTHAVTIGETWVTLCEECSKKYKPEMEYMGTIHYIELIKK